ncbi:glycosyltransferase [Sulfitobacter sp. JBTF-M27]|uniref:Glycosyltransferase n=1 Tax=Sulfitobacter sediminilitoris TaxID=2698830 RepID=A0A6P0CED7_9RHOB|nr:glycosyltransferase [Sulfitobacter sediminilitoris]NEK23720.1 glycosyltransferase [Sulfitobacter sediminilitoris]
MKVMIVVTHLLGTGHLTRALTLGGAFQDAGHRTVIVSGGMPTAHKHTGASVFVQLPPVRSDGTDFTRLIDDKGAVATDVYRTARQNQLNSLLRQEQPDALITELFPFGRRILKGEFLSLLEHAKTLPKPPKVFSSIRDILAPPSKASKATFADITVAALYDAVLVHADRNMTPLNLSWPVSERLEPTLRYTGFVAPPPAPPHPDHLGAGEVLVTAGGGDVGMALFNCAKAAAAQDDARQWRLLVGGQHATEHCELLNRDAPANMRAERARPDFRSMLHHAAASVSMCGYNTALDLLQTTCPAVFVPFDEGNEVEQGIRAQALARQPGIEMLRSSEITAGTLLTAINLAISVPREVADGAFAQGAQRTVEIVAEVCGASHAG